MNPIIQIVSWNMNDHVGHHLFPMVPYHALPQLHELLKPDTLPPYQKIIAAYKEIVPALLRQVREPDYYVRRPLPQSMTAAAK